MGRHKMQKHALTALFCLLVVAAADGLELGDVALEAQARTHEAKALDLLKEVASLGDQIKEEQSLGEEKAVKAKKAAKAKKKAPAAKKPSAHKGGMGGLNQALSAEESQLKHPTKKGPAKPKAQKPAQKKPAKKVSTPKQHKASHHNAHAAATKQQDNAQWKQAVMKTNVAKKNTAQAQWKTAVTHQSKPIHNLATNPPSEMSAAAPVEHAHAKKKIESAKQVEKDYTSIEDEKIQMAKQHAQKEEKIEEADEVKLAAEKLEAPTYAALDRIDEHAKERQEERYAHVAAVSHRELVTDEVAAQDAQMMVGTPTMLNSE